MNTTDKAVRTASLCAKKKLAGRVRGKGKVTARNVSGKRVNAVFRVYTESLALSGRRSVICLLNTVVGFLDGKSTAERYPWQTLSYEQVLDIRSTLLDMGYAINTINLVLAALRSLAKTAFNLSLMDADSMLRISGLKSVKGSVLSKGRSLRKSEVKALIATCRGRSVHDVRDKALLLLLFGAGLRRSELTELSCANYEQKRGVLQVLTAKGRKQREIYLSREVVRSVDCWLKIRGQQPGPLFSPINRAGVLSPKPLSVEGLVYIITQRGERAGLERYTAHDCRRTFITRLLEGGTDINTVRQLAGHSDISTTAGYDCRDKRACVKATKSLKLL